MTCGELIEFVELAKSAFRETGRRSVSGGECSTPQAAQQLGQILKNATAESSRLTTLRSRFTHEYHRWCVIL